MVLIYRNHSFYIKAVNILPSETRNIIFVRPPYRWVGFLRLHNKVCSVVIGVVKDCTPGKTGDDVSPQEFFSRASVPLIGGYKATQLRYISNEKYANVVARNGLA